MTSDTPDNSIATFASSERPQSSAPSILDNIRNRAIETLSALVSTLFEQIDDTFFELADAAHNNNEQNVYFESMREIRLQRKRVEHSLFTSLEQDFRVLSLPTSDNDDTPNTLDDTLSLLDHEDVEIDVAVNSMVSRARCEFPTLLLQINTRFSEFLKPINVDEDSNPLDPQQLVRHFVSACDHFQIGLQSRLIFFKQFDRLVLRHYEQVLLDTNQILIAAGILPNLRTIIRRTPEKAKPKSTPGGTNEKRGASQPSRQYSESANGNAFNTLQSLLAATKNLQEPSIYITSNLPTANQQEIFSFLDLIQDSDAGNLSPTNSTNEPNISLNVNESISALLKRQTSNQRQLDQIDTDIINIVDMIFEYIQAQNLPAPMALLIGRLQIPVLKTAIKDKAFFNTNQHPARRLLNLIGHSCLGWDHNTTPETDRLYQQVETVVSHILKHYSGDITLFEEAEQQLLAHIKQDEQRSRAMEKRTIAAEEGKAKTEQAKHLIMQLVRDRIQGKELPPVVIEFLKNPWQKLLLQALLKEGKSSYAWRSTLQMADDLIWSVQPQKNESSRKRWLKMIPVLLGDIKAGLEKTAYKPSDSDKMMSHLWKIHSQMLTYKGSDNPLRTVRVDLTDQQPPLTQNAKVEARKAELDQAIIHDLLHQVTCFKTGTWFTFTEADNKPLRCKLTTKIRATDSYVFVNRFGAKAKQLTREELAIALHDKHAKVLNAGPIIDRALETIITRLKSSLP